MLALLIYFILPPLTDLECFPSAEMADDACIFLSTRNDSLTLKLDFDLNREARITEEIDDNRAIANAWQLLTNSHKGYWTDFDRRQALQDLKDLIGPHAYFAGQMPHPLGKLRPNQSHQGGPGEGDSNASPGMPGDGQTDAYL